MSNYFSIKHNSNESFTVCLASAKFFNFKWHSAMFNSNLTWNSSLASVIRNSLARWYIFMAITYFPWFKNSVPLFFNRVASSKLSFAFIFHPSGTFLKSFSLTVYSTVAFGGIWNFSLPSLPNAKSGRITSLQNWIRMKCLCLFQHRLLHASEYTHAWPTLKFPLCRNKWVLPEFQEWLHPRLFRQERTSLRGHRIHDPCIYPSNELYYAMTNGNVRFTFFKSTPNQFFIW